MIDLLNAIDKLSWSDFIAPGGEYFMISVSLMITAGAIKAFFYPTPPGKRKSISEEDLKGFISKIEDETLKNDFVVRLAKRLEIENELLTHDDIEKILDRSRVATTNERLIKMLLPGESLPRNNGE